eukprot:c13203_g1_i1 orf=3-455(-)
MHASGFLPSALRPQGKVKNTPSENTLQSPTREIQSTAVRKSRVACDNAPLSRPAVKKPTSPPTKMVCLCAPTTHAGSFRCRLHRGNSKQFSRTPLTAAATVVPTGPKDACPRSLVSSSSVTANSPKSPSHAVDKIARRILSVPRLPSTYKP